MPCDNIMIPSSTSLIGLAGQLYSPEDRHHYTRVILKKEQLWTQLEAIRLSLQQHYNQQQSNKIENMKQHMERDKHGQQEIISPPATVKSEATVPLDTSPSSTISSYSSTRHSMSSFSLLFTKSVSMYQPQLDEYDTEFLSSYQIDRLSNQYNNTIQQLLQSTGTLPPSPVSSTASSLSKSSDYPPAPLSVKITNLSSSHHQQRHLPLSPPLSPPLSSICLSTSSSTCFITPPRTSSLQSSQPPPPSNRTSGPGRTTLTITSRQDYHAITTTGNNQIASDLFPTITHIQKNNGMRIRSFLGQSMVLNKTVRLEPQRIPRDSRFYQGKDECSGRSRVILKLSIVKSSTRNQTAVDPRLAPFGIQFSTSALSGEASSHLDLPDSLVLEALDVWLDYSNLPSISRACHVMRDGIKLYIVFDPSVLSLLNLPLLY